MTKALEMRSQAVSPASTLAGAAEASAAGEPPPAPCASWIGPSVSAARAAPAMKAKTRKMAKTRRENIYSKKFSQQT